MSSESTLQKVVVRTRKGEVRRGFSDPRQIEPSLRLINTQGDEESFDLGDLKAVFVVKEFEGDPKYEAVQSLSRLKGSRAVWVRLKFFDGEEIEGRIQNNLSLLTEDGFLIWPSDSDSNNRYAYIVKSALEEFAILSAD